MRSSGSGSGKSGGGRGNSRGAGNGRDDRRGQGQGKGRGQGQGQGRGQGSGQGQSSQGRPSKPRPEERRYDVGAGGTHDGPKSGRGASARGGAKGGPKQGQGSTGRGRWAPATSREYDARAEERNRERYAGKEDVKTPKTFPGAEQEGERLQKILARAGYGSRRACEELIEQSRVEVNGEIVVEQGLRVDPEHDEIKVDGLTVNGDTIRPSTITGN